MWWSRTQWGLPGIDPSPTSYFSFFLKRLDTNIWWTVLELLQMIKPPRKRLTPWWPWALRPIGVSVLIMLTLGTAPCFLTINQRTLHEWSHTPGLPFLTLPLCWNWLGSLDLPSINCPSLLVVEPCSQRRRFLHHNPVSEPNLNSVTILVPSEPPGKSE